MLDKIKANNPIIQKIKIDKRFRIYFNKDFNLCNINKDKVFLSLFDDGFFIANNFLVNATAVKVSKLDKSKYLCVPKEFVKKLSICCDKLANIYILENGIYISYK